MKNQKDFGQLIELVCVRVDADGVGRLWGWLVDRSGDAVTFWRHERHGRIVFKKAVTYQCNRTLSSKVDEKLAWGYSEVPKGTAAWRKLVSRIEKAHALATRSKRFHAVSLMNVRN